MFGIRKAFQMAAIRLATRVLPGLLAPKPEAPALNIVICQDQPDIHKQGKAVEALLRWKGFNAAVHTAENNTDLDLLLEELKKQRAPAPDLFLLDVCGVGAPSGRDALNWFKKTYPEKPLPAINFMSLAYNMSLSEAETLNMMQDDVEASFVDSQELHLVAEYLAAARFPKGMLPRSTALRQVVQAKLGFEIPMDHIPLNEYDKNAMVLASTTRMLRLWRARAIGAETMVNQARTAMDAYMSQISRAGQLDESEIKRHASFYSGVGFPAAGPVVFTVEEARKQPLMGSKPILLMQGYDPEVIPLLTENKLGGLVVTSTYMASHLKLMCETYMVPGLFGLKPHGEKTMTSDFNEAASPEGPPYFEGNSVEIAGQKVYKQQRILIGLSNNGLSLTPPPQMKVAKAPSLQAASTIMPYGMQVESGRAFNEIFSTERLRPFGVKVNVDSNFDSIRDYIGGIGLVRTEQMVAANAKQLDLLKQCFFTNDPQSHAALQEELAQQYRWIIAHLNKKHPVKIRLFDFAHHEIMTRDEQQQFIERYKRLDIRGGDALSTWPQLYTDQVDAIFTAYKRAGIFSGVPLEIMMPAVRGEQDVIAAKKLVDARAKHHNMLPGQYSFGVMAETVEACENISSIAPHVDFISFGTNDLTQQFFDMSRSDVKAHARFEAQNGYNPFQKLAPAIFDLMQATLDKARAVKPQLKADVCGAQAADAKTAVDLFNIGVDNVSVAPTARNIFNLPTAIHYKIYDILRDKPSPAPTPITTPRKEP